jgi:hypothetical protein
LERVGRARAAAEAAGLDTLVVTVLGARGLGALAARGGGKQRRVHLGLVRAAAWPAAPAAMAGGAPEEEVRAWEERANAAAVRSERVGALALAGDAVGAAAAAVAAVAAPAVAAAAGEEQGGVVGEKDANGNANGNVVVLEEGELLDEVDIGGDVPRTAAVDATRDAIGWPDGPQRLELPMGSAADAALLLRLLLEDAPKGDGASASRVSTTVASAVLSLEAMALAPRQVWGAASGGSGGGGGAPPAPPALSFGVRKCWLPLSRVGGGGSGGGGAGAAEAAAPCGELEVEVEWVSRRRQAAREGVEEAKRMAAEAAASAALATAAATVEMAEMSAAAGEREAAAEREGAGESAVLKLELEQQKEVCFARFVCRVLPTCSLFLRVWRGSQQQWRGANCMLSRAGSLASPRTDPTPHPHSPNTHRLPIAPLPHNPRCWPIATRRSRRCARRCRPWRRPIMRARNSLRRNNLRS